MRKADEPEGKTFTYQARVPVDAGAAAALDAYAKAPHSYSVAPDWRSALAALSEGSQTTLGAYHRSWQ
jgi:hypothetical protein